MVKVIKGLPAEWGTCSRTVLLKSFTRTLSFKDNTVAVGSEYGDIIILDIITGSQTSVFSGHTNQILCLTFSPNGILLASASSDDTVKLWDMQTGGVVRTFVHPGTVFSVSISADCSTIASGSYNMKLCLWDIQTRECHYTIRQQSAVDHVRFSPTNPLHLISICNGKVWQWDTSGHQIKPPCDGSYVAFSSDGNQFVSCNGAAVTLQESNSGVIAAKFHVADNNTEYCCFSPNGKLVAVAAGNNAYIWDTSGSEPHLVETLIGHTNKITSLAFSSPSSLISASCDRSVKFWQLSNSPTGLIAANPRSTPITLPLIWAVSLQAGGEIAISSDTDGVKTWDILTGLCKASFQTPAKNCKRDVQLINSRLIIVWYTKGKIKVWDAEKDKPVLEVDGPVCNVLDLRISGDGSKIFCIDKTSRFMDRRDFGQWRVYTFHRRRILCYRWLKSLGQCALENS